MSRYARRRTRSRHQRNTKSRSLTKAVRRLQKKLPFRIIRKGRQMEGKICRWCHEGEYVWRENPHLRISSAEDCTIECNVCGEPPMTFEEAHEADGQADKHHAADPQKHSIRGLVHSQQGRMAARGIGRYSVRLARGAVERWGSFSSADT